MKAISLWQPWASLPFTFCKKYETRHWATSYRGPLAIHAAQKLVTNLEDDLHDLLVEQFGRNWARELPRGKIVGIVRLTGCHPTESLLDVDAIEQLCGNWQPGRYAWRASRSRAASRRRSLPGAAKGSSTGSIRRRLSRLAARLL